MTKKIDDEDLAETFNALSDERRLRALRFIAEGDPAAGEAGEAVCACHVQDHLGLSQPATSYHMKVLRQAGLVSAEKSGRWVHYRIAPRGLDALRAFADQLDAAGPARPEAVA